MWMTNDDFQILRACYEETRISRVKGRRFNSLLTRASNLASQSFCLNRIGESEEVISSGAHLSECESLPPLLFCSFPFFLWKSLDKTF